MDRNELVDLLGTIAKSGSKFFKAQNTDKGKESIIGNYCRILFFNIRIHK